MHSGQTSPSYGDSYVEAMDTYQIYDGFSEKKGSLKEPFEQRLPNALVFRKHLIIINSGLQETLLCNAHIFEVTSKQPGTQHPIYELMSERENRRRNECGYEGLRTNSPCKCPKYVAEVITFHHE